MEVVAILKKSKNRLFD